MALIGPNGCGKTTLIKSILGMVVPDSGDILFNGQPVIHEWKYREYIGYMPQVGRYPENMTVGQLLEMIKALRSDRGKQLDEELIRSFELERFWDKRMGTLSGGTRQKVSASLAFLFDPDVLILDEPTAGLDPVASEILKHKIITEKQKGKLIMITSHILSDLDDLATHIVYMQDGKIKFHKNIDAVREETGEVKLSKAIAHIMLNT
jgi:Cu-processing system ATP-binding protein